MVFWGGSSESMMTTVRNRKLQSNTVCLECKAHDEYTIRVLSAKKSKWTLASIADDGLAEFLG